MVPIMTMVNSKCCVEHHKNEEEKGGVEGVLCNLATTHVSEYKKTRKWGWEPILLEGTEKTE